MRALTPTERGYLTDPEGHWCFGYAEVTNFDGTWINLGNVAVGSRVADFLNTFGISDNIDANTLSMSGTFLREVGASSLVPFRSDSPLNVDDTGVTYSPLLDLHRSWRFFGVILPIGTFPSSPSDYREWWTGIVDRIDIQGDPATITVQGRGMEADIIDARIAFVDNTADPPTAIAQGSPKTYASGTLDDVLQAILDDEMGAGAIPLTVAGSAPSDFVNGWDQESDTGAMDLLSLTAGLFGGLLRYKYDSSDVLSFTLFSPNRTPSTPDWSTDGGEYEKLDAGIGLNDVRNYVYVRYFDATFGQPLVVTSPAGSPNAATSASIARFRKRTMSIDLAASTQVNDQTAAGNLADAARSDLEFPIIEHTLTGHGFWFAELGDYVQLLANGIHYDQDQFGGITAIQHTFANGELTSVLGMRAKPAGRYRGWLDFGPGAPRTPFAPTLDQFNASWYDPPAPATTAGILYSGYMGRFCQSVLVEIFDDSAYTSLREDRIYDAPDSPFLDTWVLPDQTLDRNTTYYLRATPYSALSVAGAPAGTAGTPLYAQVYAGTQWTPKSTYDADIGAINGNISDLQGEPVTVWDDPTVLTNARKWVDSATATINTATPNEIAVDVPAVASVGVALGSVSAKEVFVRVTEDDQWLALSTIPASEVEIGTEYRTKRYLVGMGSVRFNANIKTLTGTPTLKLKYSTNAFGSVADVATWAPSGTGQQSSGFIAVPTAAKVDAGLTLYIADGAGTAALDLYALDAEFIPATVSGVREHSDEHAPEFS